MVTTAIRKAVVRAAKRAVAGDIASKGVFDRRLIFLGRLGRAKKNQS
jgi:hypothetical protein